MVFVFEAIVVFLNISTQVRFPVSGIRSDRLVYESIFPGRLLRGQQEGSVLSDSLLHLSVYNINHFIEQMASYSSLHSNNAIKLTSYIEIKMFLGY